MPILQRQIGVMCSMSSCGCGVLTWMLHVCGVFPTCCMYVADPGMAPMHTYCCWWCAALASMPADCVTEAERRDSIFSVYVAWDQTLNRSDSKHLHTVQILLVHLHCTFPTSLLFPLCLACFVGILYRAYTLHTCNLHAGSCPSLCYN